MELGSGLDIDSVHLYSKLKQDLFGSSNNSISWESIVLKIETWNQEASHSGRNRVFPNFVFTLKENGFSISNWQTRFFYGKQRSTVAKKASNTAVRGSIQYIVEKIIITI